MGGHLFESNSGTTIFSTVKWLIGIMPIGNQAQGSIDFLRLPLIRQLAESE
jgi:hypothetical protein